MMIVMMVLLMVLMRFMMMVPAMMVMTVDGWMSHWRSSVVFVMQN